MLEAQSIRPPKAAKKAHLTEIHGLKLNDPYYWMRERDSKEVLEYIKAENAFTDAVMADTKDQQQAIYDELLGRIQETDQTVPVRDDDYLYYSRTVKGLQYSIYCRKYKSLEAEEEIILDANELAEGNEYFSIGAVAVSPDHSILAYCTDTDGSENHTLYIKNLSTGELFAESMEGLGTSLDWSEDGKYLFYNTLDETMRPYRLYRHRLGTACSEDVLIYEEKDPGYFLSLSKTKSRRFFILYLHSNSTTEVHVLSTINPLGQFKLAQPRERELEYDFEDGEQGFYVLTNDQARNFRLMLTPFDALDKAHWVEVIPHRDNIKLEDVEVFRDYMLVFEREAGITHIRVIKLDGSADYRIEFEEPVFHVWEGANPDYFSQHFRFGYTSLVVPHSVYSFDVKTKGRTLLKQQPVLGKFDQSAYATERLFAMAPDGVQVPVSLVYRKDLRKPEGNPCLLYGYGSYGISIDPEFSSTRLSLLDRGFVYAIAHIRGGGDLGRPWYDDGKLLNKKNTFSDFIAAAEMLIEQGYTRPQTLAIYGGSAGGLLMGAVTNMRPDLFHAVIAKVPFVDVINTMLDESIPLTILEYEEWGNPNVTEYFKYIYDYTPYEHVEAKSYPHMLITGGLNDPRVQYWEPTKWVAKLRDCATGDKLLLLKMFMGAGHSGNSGRYDYLKDLAFDYAFLFKALGIQL